jgi:hypothetical protein
MSIYNADIPHSHPTIETTNKLSKTSTKIMSRTILVFFGVLAVVVAESHITSLSMIMITTKVPFRLITDQDLSLNSIRFNIIFSGEKVYIRSSGECQDVPSHFNDRASSVDTHNSCMTVFEHGGCQGRHFNYSPGQGSHHRLTEQNLNDAVSSVRAC